ncbi:DUF4256 domain-containing protein [Rheinheimera marina]|uniref:DUF4256 domain-containing protein n=1 Tax=Rheinheimera marina TaxID=1774958 RepID=A0ABV9JIJ7_9GAMM
MSEQAIIELLQQRFNRKPLPGLTPNWAELSQRFEQNAGKLQALQWMQDSGGEPALIGLDEQSGEYLIADCSAETPKGRRSLCYDDAALAERKEHKPAGSAVQLAAQYGLTLLTEAEYQQLQQLGPLDQKSSSWLLTPAEIRAEGGAIFGDYRYGRVFIYHNGAQSYYAVRGFRAMLRL